MSKRSIGSLMMRKKLSDITNSVSPSHPSIQQLLQEKMTLMQLIAQKDEMIELNGAELRRLQDDIKKLQLQNWNLAHTNTSILAELNMGRERIKTLQHEISWRAALLKGNFTNHVVVPEKVEMDHKHEKNVSLSQVHGLKEGDEKSGQPSPKPSNDEQQCHVNKRRIRSKSVGSTTDSTRNATKDKVKDRRRLRRHSAMSSALEPLENLFEIEDAMMPSSTSSRNEAPRNSFGRPLRRAAQEVQSYKEVPLNVKMRRLE